MRQRSDAGLYDRPALNDSDRKEIFQDWSLNQDDYAQMAGDQDLT
jgi:hypothetical protein